MTLVYVLLGFIIGGGLAASILYAKDKQMLDDLRQTKHELEQAQHNLDCLMAIGLSDREREVFYLRMAGWTISRMAKALNCDDSTINREIKVLKNKGYIQEGVMTEM